MQAIANTAWSCSRSVFVDHPLRNSIAAAERAMVAGALDVTYEFAPGLVSTSWAFSALEVVDFPWMTALSASARENIPHFDHQQLSKTAWSFSRRLFADKPLCLAMSAAAVRCVGDLNAQDLSNTARSYVVLATPDYWMLSAMFVEAVLWLCKPLP